VQKMLMSVQTQRKILVRIEEIVLILQAASFALAHEVTTAAVVETLHV